jgi:RNA polymerase sigma-70 factor (ECF subfamily)
MRSSEKGREPTAPGSDTGIDRKRARFESLVHENSRAILGYALRRTERPEDAADVLSEVLLIAWRRLDDIPRDSEARLWLFGVARRVIANENRSAAARLRLGERLRREVSPVIPDDATAVDERERVRAALGRLGEEDREILLLVTWEDLKVTDAAKVIGISAAGARSRLHRARRRLRRELAEADGDGNSESLTPALHVTKSGLQPRIEEES